MDKYIDKLDERWQALPVRKQCRYTCYFFMGYLLLTAGTVFKVWYDIKTSDDDMTIEHIENPVPKKGESPIPLQDTLSMDNPKNEIYEGK